MEEAPKSPYRVGNWTVTKLKDELRERKLSPVGKKEELIQRLERFDGYEESATPLKTKGIKNSTSQFTITNPVEATNEIENPFAESPGKRRGRPPKIGTPLRKTLSVQQANHLNPIFVAKYSFLFAITSIAKIFKFLAFNPVPLVLVILSVAILAGAILIEGPHHVVAKPAVVFYGRWFLLGILNALGANSFVALLGPFIARITTTSLMCNSVDFDLASPQICPPASASITPVNALTVFFKVLPVVPSWGVGCVIGCIPVFLLSRLALLARKAAFPVSNRKLGLAWVFAFAAIPIPFSGLFSSICGFFEVPLRRFIVTTLFATCLIAAPLQALLVIILFSRKEFDVLTRFLRGNFGEELVNWVIYVRKIFISEKTLSFSLSFNFFQVGLLIALFLSIAHSVAVYQDKKTQH